MLPAKILVAVAALGVVSFDATAERILLAAAVVTAVGVLWRKLLRPISKIVLRTVAALEALEHLPARWAAQEIRDNETDQRLADVESEVGIVQASVELVGNDVAAIRRDLGITDADVRNPPTPPRPRRDL